MKINLVQPRDRIFVKGNGFLSFEENMGKKTAENISKNVSGNYSPVMLSLHQKPLDHAK